MKFHFVGRLKITLAIGAVLLAAAGTLVNAQQDPKRPTGQQNERRQRRQDKQQSGQEQPASRNRRQDQQQSTQKQPEYQQQSGQQQPGDRQQSGQERKEQEQQIEHGPGRQPFEKQQQEQMERQSRRMNAYHDRLEHQHDVAEKRWKYLEQQNRREHARYHHDYLEHMREQEIRLRMMRDYDYRHDPYFSTPPCYRYYRGGRYYDVNQYAANVLQQAVNNGYEEGFHAGRADMMDRWRYNYEDCYAYEDATYGYSGYYVDLNEYRYYFREGFRRGYDDGYYNCYNYGIYEDGKYIILTAILARILYLIPLH